MTWTALPITSAGRFSPLGPRGILELVLIDFAAIDVFDPNVAIALVVKVFPVFSGIIDRIAQHLCDLALAIAPFHYERGHAPL
jgi:hypothetical protein